MAEANANSGRAAQDENAPALCDTHLERGQERLATRHGAFGHLCEDCFNGKPTCREEVIGGGPGEATQRYVAKNREKILKRSREWRKNNREHVRKYWREWRLKNLKKTKAQRRRPARSGRKKEDAGDSAERG